MLADRVEEMRIPCIVSLRDFMLVSGQGTRGGGEKSFGESVSQIVPPCETHQLCGEGVEKRCSVVVVGLVNQ